MRKKLLIVTGLLFSSLGITLNAQTPVTVAAAPSFHRVEFGARFMPTVSAFSVRTSSGGTVKGEGTFGYGIEGLLAFNFSNHVGIQGEIIYNSLSQKYKDQNLDREINVRYLNIPVLFSLNTGKANIINLNMVFGPQLGINMGSSIKKSGGNNTDTVTYVFATKKSDFGFAYGAGLEFMLNEIRTLRLDIGFRGVYGLIDINDNTAPQPNESAYIIQRAKVRTQAIYIGFSFLF